MDLDKVASHDEEYFNENLENERNVDESDSPIPYRRGVSYLEALSMDDVKNQIRFIR